MTRAAIVLLAHRHDVGARAVATGLRGGPGPVLVLPPDELSRARWSHAIDVAGCATTTVTVRNGWPLADKDIGCLLNRIDYLPVARFDRSAERDRDYAAMEVQALVASWLAGLGDRVVNRPTARSTDDGPTSVRLWLALAAAHGLPVVRSAVATSARLLCASGEPVRPLGPWVPNLANAPTGRVPVEVGWSASQPDADLYQEDEVIVAGDQAVGPLAPRFGALCVTVAEAAGCRLASFSFAATGAGPMLQNVTSRPQLHQSDAVGAVVRLLDAMARASAGRR